MKPTMTFMTLLFLAGFLAGGPRGTGGSAHHDARPLGPPQPVVTVTSEASPAMPPVDWECEGPGTEAEDPDSAR